MKANDLFKLFLFVSTAFATTEVAHAQPGFPPGRPPRGPHPHGPPPIRTSQNAAMENQCQTQIAADAPAWMREFRCVTVRVDASSGTPTLAIRTRDVPPHRSFYFGSESPLFEALPPGRFGNPNRIAVQDYELRIPLNPKIAERPTQTSLDAIGVAVNGVLLFNNEAAPGDSLTQEMATFDHANGHPTPSGTYHYHVDPLEITGTSPSDLAVLVGVLLDGFPVYGKWDDAKGLPRIPRLDEAHGHFHPTRHFPEGQYHYHVTDSDPYIAAVYKGRPGTLRR